MTGEEAPLAAARKDVRDSSIALAAGLGALTAGLLAWGRLDLSRRENDRGDRSQFTDRFTRAIDQLGSGAASIRVGALYALEALAEESVADRQRVADVICGFARDRTSALGRDSAGWQELARARAEVNYVESDRRYGALVIEERQWDGFDAIDYRAALTIALRLPPEWNLDAPDLRGVVITDWPSAGYEGRSGDVDFSRAVFVKPLTVYTTFAKALFNAAEFLGSATFRGAFLDLCTFDNAHFRDTFDLSAAVVWASFESATFERDATWAIHSSTGYVSLNLRSSTFGADLTVTSWNTDLEVVVQLAGTSVAGAQRIEGATGSI